MKNLFKRLFSRNVKIHDTFQNIELLIIWENDNWLSKLIQYWKNDGSLKINNGAAYNVIAKTEDRLCFKYPEYFVDFYNQVNGFNDGDTIGMFFQFGRLIK